MIDSTNLPVPELLVPQAWLGGGQAAPIGAGGGPRGEDPSEECLLLPRLALRQPLLFSEDSRELVQQRLDLRLPGGATRVPLGHVRRALRQRLLRRAATLRGVPPLDHLPRAR